MKLISIKCLSNSKTTLEMNELHFESENLAAKIVVDYSSTAVSDWNKVVKCFMADGSFKAFNLNTDPIVEALIDNSVTVAGNMTIQVYAIASGDPNAMKVMFEERIVPFKGITKDGDPAAKHPDLIDEIFLDITNLENTKSDKTYVDTELAKKVDKITGKSLIDDAEIIRLAGVNNYNDTAMQQAITDLDAAKVDKVTGQGLSDQNYTLAEKQKLAGVEPGAQVNQVNSVAGKNGDITLVKADVGLGNVDNTSDQDKPVSAAQQTALNTKADVTNVYTRNDLRNKKVVLQRLTDIKAILGSNLVAFYPLNDFEGTTAKDHSGANTHVTLSPSGITHVQSPFDEVNSAMRFDGTAFINLIALQSKYNGNNYSVFFDLQLTTNDWSLGSKRLFSFYKDGNNRIWGSKTSSGLSISRFANGVLKTAGVVNQQTAADGYKWERPVHFLATWNRTNLDLYINGVLVSTVSSTEEYIGLPSLMAFGADSASSASLNTTGIFANFGMVNRYIEAHEAKEIYNAINPKGLSLTVIGDSISNDNIDWPVYFLNNQNTYHFMRSKAVAGQSIVTHMTTQTTEALKDSSDTVIILMGANDNNAGDMVVLQSTVESNLDRLKRKNPSASIYVINVLPAWTNNTGSTSIDKSNIRAAIQSACIAKAVTCWDSFGEQWIVASDTSDGLHPTNAGSLKVALKVKEKLGIA